MPAGGKQTPVPLVNIGPISANDTLDAERARDLHAAAGARRPTPARRATSQRGTAAARPSRSRPTTSAPRPSARLAGYATTRSRTSTTSTCPDCDGQGRVFVGQRKESFAVNLGAIFDLVNAPASVVVGGNTRDGRSLVPSTLDDKNITTLALELPIALPQGQGRRDRRLDHGQRAPGAHHQPARHATSCRRFEGGAWTQVSRLSAPLVNEVVIGLPGQGPLQRQPAQGRRAVRRLRHQPQPARADRDPVRRRRRGGAQPVPARRSGRRVPHRRRRA